MYIQVMNDKDIAFADELLLTVAQRPEGMDLTQIFEERGDTGLHPTRYVEYIRSFLEQEGFIRSLESIRVINYRFPVAGKSWQANFPIPLITAEGIAATRYGLQNVLLAREQQVEAQHLANIAAVESLNWDKISVYANTALTIVTVVFAALTFYWTFYIPK